MGTSPESPSNEQILEHLRNLEERIARIESHLDIQPASAGASAESDSTQTIAAEDDEALELQLGQNWFAKAGIVGLALGIAFLLTLPYNGLPPFLPSALGYVLVAGIFFFSYFWKESFQQVSRYLLGGGLLLLYFTTLRLSYFSSSPALGNTSLEDGLLLLAVAISYLVAIRRESIYLASIGLILGCLTALIGGTAPFVLSVLTILSVVTALLSVRYQWNVLLTLGICLTFLTHLLWSANNPLLGNALQFGLSPQPHLLFILIYASVFASAILVRGKENPENAPFIFNSFLNSLLAFGVFVVSTLVETNFTIAVWNVVASVVFLALSILFWIRQKSIYATFVYAMVGYAALSVAIVAQFPMPDFFVWLCWQSILVVSTAVWFRSRFIIVANFIIYLVIFIAYLITAATVSTVSVSFGVAALISARILNWQRDRLVLRTELMRNAYLASALLFLPYALYHSVPARFISVSWLVLALFYYIGGRVLKSRKYRWMALLTMSLTVLYVFIVDLTAVDPAVRIVSFLVLGIALLAISMFYSRKKRKSGTEPVDSGSTR
jgi:uncharacterized membrane protein